MEGHLDRYLFQEHMFEGKESHTLSSNLEFHNNQ